MSHMKPEFSYGSFQIISDTPVGDICVPKECAGYSDEEAANLCGVPTENVETVIGYGARMTAPGYLDCTDWTVHDSKQEAAQYLLDTYGNDMEPEDWEAELREIINED